MGDQIPSEINGKGTVLGRKSRFGKVL